MANRLKTIGVLGGMGPAATVDFLAKVIAATPARADQDHVPMIVSNIPQIPDRSRAIIEKSDAPLAALLEGLKMLETAGAEVLVMPCNTAHRWFGELARHASIPMIHIVDAVKREAVDSGESPLGLAATRGTIRAGIYQDRFGSASDRLLLPDEESQKAIDSAILKVKAGSDGRYDAERGVEGLMTKGAHRIILACTELPLALLHSPFRQYCIDATEALAKQCVAVSYAASQSEGVDG